MEWEIATMTGRFENVGRVRFRLRLGSATAGQVSKVLSYRYSGPWFQSSTGRPVADPYYVEMFERGRELQQCKLDVQVPTGA
jgi:hypothetical protein